MKQWNGDINPLSATPIKWSLKQFVGKLPTNCLSVFDHFVGLARKVLSLMDSKFHEMVKSNLTNSSVYETLKINLMNSQFYETVEVNLMILNFKKMVKIISWIWT